MPPSLRMCMDSWKKVLPDYEWKRWSLRDFNVNSLPWTKEARAKLVHGLLLPIMYACMHCIRKVEFIWIQMYW